MFTGLIQQVGKLAAKETNGDSLRIGIIISAQKWNPPLTRGESISVNGVCLTVAEITESIAKVGPEPTPAFGHPSDGGDLNEITDKSLCSPPGRGTRSGGWVQKKTFASSSTNTGFICDVLKETINCSNLGVKQVGAALNLERAIKAGEPLGGHLITGHVEGLGTLIRRMNIGRDWKLDFSCDKALLHQMVSKGSIACDGVSLTIASLEKNSFSVNIIPFTWANTNLHQLREGETVNLETDLIGKYVFRWMEQNQGGHPPSPRLWGTGKSGEKPARSITEDILRKAGFFE